MSCTCKVFIKRFPALHLNNFVPNAFNKRNLPLVQDKNIFCLAFDHAKESVSSKKCWVIKQNSEQNLVKKAPRQMSLKNIKQM